MMAERKRRKFTPEFKKDAVALVTEQGHSVTKAAQAVDVNEALVQATSGSVPADTTWNYNRASGQ